MSELSKEHQMIRDAAREFARQHIAPIAAEFDESGDFPIDTVRGLGEQGLMGVSTSADYGGAGMDAMAYVLTLIEVSKADAAHGTIMSVNNSLYNAPLEMYGSEEQKQKYLVPVASGEKIGAFSLTEPMSGSDAGTMKSRAVLSDDGSHYVINGTKSWVSNAPYADFIVLYTLTDPEQKHRGVTAFIIDTKQAGFSLGKKEPKLGIRASGTCEIVFDDYRCPIEDRLGEEGQGFKIAMTTLDGGRIGIAAQAVGIAEAALEASVAYAQEREAFGQKIGQFQMVQQKLADMKTRLEAARLLTFSAARKKSAATPGDGSYALDASMAKLFASEAATWITSQAIQVHGGVGYSKELPLERYYRDAKITEIYEGTSEIQRMVISRHLTGLR